MAAARHGAQARQQFVQFERLDDVVVGAAVQAADAVAELVARGHQQHRGGVVALAQRAQQRQAGLAGQADVQQDQLVGVVDQRKLRLHPIDPRAEFALQRGLQRVAQHRVVFHQ